jgi:tRNA (guanine-N7-)-methyltransferase
VYGVPVADGADGAPLDGAPLDPAAHFGRDAPLVLEIGSGMGEATLAMAGADPGRDYLAVEIHTPGVASLLAGIERHGLPNVRVAFGDALDLLRHQVRPGTLDAVHAFFPDPWPKGRHHKRRLIQPYHVALIASRLRPGGTLWCSTDWADYAEAMVAALTADRLLIRGDGPAAPPRPVTRFEQRGLDAGRTIFDLVFHRR